MINNELKKRILSSIFLIPIAIYFIIQENIFFVFFLSILFLVSSYEWIKMNKKDIFKVIGIFYLFFAFYSAYLLREKLSIGIFILILVICVFSDLGGYTFGKILKGPKLTKISPKKTYSGVIGSFIMSIIAALLYTKTTIIEISVNLNFSIWLSNNFASDNIFILFILFTSLISQVGDLIVSYFKRLAKVKDTGILLPGHGGLLDRLDGIIFAIPMSYLLLNYIK
tara:strand:+ start:659 stop:1333 length:675 start_codon:yes stop_codon:yes gene_type:complete